MPVPSATKAKEPHKKKRNPRSRRAKSGASSAKKTPLAAKADRHDLYQRAVQAVDSEIDFVDDTFKELRGRRATLMREDFCGTANTSCEWVRRRPGNRAIGVDLDLPTLEWGRKHNLAKLKGDGADRVTLLNENVLSVQTEPVDIVLAMNFSYFIFEQRDIMRRYFASVRESLAEGGLFFLDCYGGYDSFRECQDKRPINKDFTYVWDQYSYDPITGHMVCYIHFHFRDGSKMNRAFHYEWRLWTLPEIRELLLEAGFQRATVYWEGTDDSGEGDGNFEPATHGEADAAWIAYVVAEK